MTDIVLVRHGETAAKADGYFGSTDVPLAERGMQQAGDLAVWARTADLAGVWSSDLARAMATAQPSAAAAGVQLQVDPRLREVDFGDAEGRTRDELSMAMPVESVAFARDPVANHWPGGEDPADAAKRGLGCLHEIAASVGDRRVLVVCHTTLIRLMFCSLLGVPINEYRRLLPFVHNGFLNEIRMQDGQVSVMSWNAPPASRGRVDDP